MRVVSWNVNGIRACVRHGFVDFVDRSGADIVGVQEVRARPEDIPPAARRRRCCMKTLRWGGLARISHDPPQDPHYRDAVEGPSHV